MRDNFRKYLHRDLKSARDTVAKVGGAFEDHRPDYLTPAVWNRLCSHWSTKKFNDNSVAATGYRKQVKLTHNSGPCSYDFRARELEKEKGRLPTRLEVFLDTHQPKKKNLADPEPDLPQQVKDIQGKEAARDEGGNKRPPSPRSPRGGIVIRD